MIRDEELKKELGEEGYLLDVKPASISITAPTSTGIFYGIQSLRQLIIANGNAFMINTVRIKDKPRFVWRAFLLDEGRYFKGSAVVKRLLDDRLSRRKKTKDGRLERNYGH
ncbi:glycoside hydrolase family 20 zincin-like fold domain-containing protein [Chitinophaga sp. 22321]|uniref:beta-N-acetylhexosaminidase n=1 Tax=Chitinophaga hostae TaxID=2831022 RepID=A0ABS5IZD4_9BACT|nr:glycoside hydrolase family 20 zincin-like fold domain-containing protein [Chitinophaga hostae]MBS0028225.1 hypothetical protein [Chitinophaga hostae]